MKFAGGKFQQIKHDPGTYDIKSLFQIPMPTNHIHKYLPSKGCSWKCACGATFIACICGKGCK